jgi:hypothetical protein
MATADDEYREEERLPWLETADAHYYEEGPSIVRLILLVLLGLAVLAAIVFGIYYVQTHHAASGNGALINAQEGSYKVKPDEPGGMNVTGEGDSAIATSEGAAPGNASIDLKAVPEAPIAGKKAAAPAAGGSAKVTEVPRSGGALKANAPVAATKTKAPSGGGGSIVQLGSFPTESAANTQWTQMSKRFGYIAPLGKSVQKAEVNGRTVYRLRVNAGSASQATEVCGKLKVAGEPCFIAHD